MAIVVMVTTQELVPKKEHDTETLGDILEEEMTATALVSIPLMSLAPIISLYRQLMKLLLGLRCALKHGCLVVLP